VRYNYGYDAAWNVTSFTNALGADSFSMDGRNQITSDGVYGIGYYYDANGDLIESYNSGYHYDAECRLVSVVSGDGDTFEYPPVQSDVRTDFVYDGLGRLRKQIYYGAVECDEFEGYCWQVAGETHYIYDGMRVIQERNVNDVPTVSYTRGNDLSGTMEGAGGIGGLLARSYAYQSGSGAFASHHYYFADGNGNISYLETTSQSLGALYSYDPFGNQEYGIGVMANANKYRFSSKEIVAENSYEFPIYYFGYRFYAPSLQRWLNRDPLEEPGFEAFLGGGFFPGSAGQNLYAFVRDNPISRADALGLCDIKIRCGSVKRAGVTLGVHCGVVAPNGVEYGLGGGDQSSGSSGTAHPYPSGPNPSPGPVNPPAGDKDYPVSCPCKSCDDVQNSIQDYHDNVTPPSYRATGPNSDTYAHNMLDAAGCGVNPIPREPLNIFRGPGTPPIILPLPPTTTPPGTVAW
ncbi:MAG TPA: RHS repeat-associated core domain-containing protein, partial [Verrucomicrobiae bacterium]|nr:RHS repeat-associated core domain-containing protein [Verrucomicrobiae bacterium]